VLQADTVARHRALSDSVQNAMLMQLGLCLFTIVTILGTSDSALIVGDAKIKVPFANADMALGGFMIAIPLILIVVFIYLQIYLGMLSELERTPIRDRDSNRLAAADKVPAVFNIDGRVPRAMADVALYWAVPATLAVLTWKVGFTDMIRPMWLLTVLVAAGVILIRIRREDGPRRGMRNAFRWCTILVLLVSIPDHRVMEFLIRPAQLEHADLEGKRLNFMQLKKARLADANLKQVQLRRADLRGADLSRANLDGANLHGAKLELASLREASMQGANLRGADLSRSSLQQANLQRANLEWTNMHLANLEGANLHGASLQGADLSFANLYLVRGLVQEQIDRACVAAGGRDPLLPTGLRRPATCAGVRPLTLVP
jgi:hypothetical protein